MIQILNLDQNHPDSESEVAYAEITQEQYDQLLELLQEPDLEEWLVDSDVLQSLEEKGCEPDVLDAIESALQDLPRARLTFRKLDAER